MAKQRVEDEGRAWLRETLLRLTESELHRIAATVKVEVHGRYSFDVRFPERGDRPEIWLRVSVVDLPLGRQYSPEELEAADDAQAP